MDLTALIVALVGLSFLGLGLAMVVELEGAIGGDNMNRTLLISVILIGIAFSLGIGLALYDWWAWEAYGAVGTVSRIWASLYANNPWISLTSICAAYLGGVIHGHVGWPQSAKSISKIRQPR